TPFSRRFSASTVRPPSTVSLTVPARVAYDARSQRYPAGARFRYQRVLKKSSGTPARAGSAASGVTQIAAARAARVDPDRGAHREHRRDSGDQRFRNGEADRARERVDVRGRPRDEVAGP